MMSFQRLTNGKLKVRINYSSVDMLNTCHRKAYYYFNRRLRSQNESAPLVFGSAIHKALEHWYSLPYEKRTIPEGKDSKATLEFLSVGAHDMGLLDGNLESIRQFVLAAQPLKDLHSKDKRSISNGVKILKGYFQTYANDRLEILNDSEGKPYIECGFSFPLYEDNEVEIEYFGTIDAILRNSEFNTVFVADHKTTSVLGSQFYNRIHPNPQYTGYLLGAQKCFGIKTNTFMVNGIQVASTKTEFARQFTDRNEEDFKEFTATVVEAVKRWVQAMEKNIFVQNAPNPCGNYGSCTYLDVCSVPSVIRENVIQSRWGPK